MRILVVSDSHRMNFGIQKIIMENDPFDMMIHLGDSEISESEMREIVGCPVEMVAGNCDTGSFLPKEKIIKIGDSTILLTHGHLNGVNYGYERLINHGLEKGADIVMFGHIHRPVMMEMPGIKLVNPGSITLPRQEPRKRTWILMDVDEKNKINFKFNYVE